LSIEYELKIVWVSVYIAIDSHYKEVNNERSIRSTCLSPRITAHHIVKAQLFTERRDTPRYGKVGTFSGTLAFTSRNLFALPKIYLDALRHPVAQRWGRILRQTFGEAIAGRTTRIRFSRSDPEMDVVMRESRSYNRIGYVAEVDPGAYQGQRPTLSGSRRNAPRFNYSLPGSPELTG
jgi:hypothetical protein